MKKNMGIADRIIRFLVAAVIAILFFTNVITGILGIILLVVAGVFVVINNISVSPPYLPLGLSFGKSITLFTCAFIWSNVGAQNNDPVEPIDNIFQGTRLVNEQSANLVEKGKLNLLIQHRFGEIDGGFYELFGLDQAAMHLGFEYGFGHDFTAGFGRSSYMKTYDVYGKFRFAQQTTNFPLTIAIIAAGSIPTVKDYFPSNHSDLTDKLSGNVQLLFAKSIDAVGIQISPGYLTTGYLLSEGEKVSLFTTAFAGSVKLSKKVTANLEYLAHFNSDFNSDKPLSLGVDIETGGHLFQLVLSNSQRMFTKGLYTNTFGDWTDGTLFFGFNLIREFRIKYN
ncbi:MAG TPA: DUF5777 family beta-barrel protein [Prolixibacteraceae bacterium]|nr:DUF5777 family beta-barrel protein [Prolixibacteraceae bacterium]